MEKGMRKFNQDSSSSSAHVHQPRTANSDSNSAMKITQIPVKEWKCPPEILIKDEWRVASGEESKEREIQMLRETQVAEAIYPNLSSIPPSPLEPLGKEILHEDDESNIREIPLIGIEELEGDTSEAVEEADTSEAVEAANMSEAAEGEPQNTSVHSQTADTPLQGSSTLNINIAELIPYIELLTESDIHMAIDAVSLALKADKICEEMGDLIDKDLLIELLKNPHLIEELSNKISSDTPLVPKPATESLPIIGSRPATQSNLCYNVTAPSLGLTYTPIFPAAPIAPPVRDVNFIKSLIEEHGEIRENQSGKYSNDFRVPEPVKNVSSSGMESKYQKPCFYFNSPQGCRNGSACLYKHVAPDQPRSSNWAAGPSGGKRLRL